MPIEIRELVIRATVDPTGGGGSAGADAGGCGVSAGRNAAGAGREAAYAPGDELVQACVREVMRLLERKAER